MRVQSPTNQNSTARDLHCGFEVMESSKEISVSSQVLLIKILILQIMHLTVVLRSKIVMDNNLSHLDIPKKNERKLVYL